MGALQLSPPSYEIALKASQPLPEFSRSNTTRDDELGGHARDSLTFDEQGNAPPAFSAFKALLR